MREEADFSVLYKKLIDGHFAPEQQRAKAALFAVLSRLSESEPDEEPAIPDAAPGEGDPQEDRHANEAATPQEQKDD